MGNLAYNLLRTGVKLQRTLEGICDTPLLRRTMSMLNSGIGIDKSTGVSASDRDILRVGICQIYTEQWQIEQNFKRTVEALEEAAGKGAVLAITPECVLHGYGFSDDKELLHKQMLEVSEELSGEKVSEIRALSKDLSLNVVLGIAERGVDKQIHNSALPGSL